MNKEELINSEEEKKVEYEMSRDMFYNLRYGSVTNAEDEFIKCRDILSNGDLIFIYKNSKNEDIENNLLEICIRINNVYTTNDNITKNLDSYIVELYTENYSVIYPHVPRTFLEVEIYELLENSRVPSDVLVTYKQIIEDLKVWDYCQ